MHRLPFKTAARLRDLALAKHRHVSRQKPLARSILLFPALLSTSQENLYSALKWKSNFYKRNCGKRGLETAWQTEDSCDKDEALLCLVLARAGIGSARLVSRVCQDSTSSLGATHAFLPRYLLVHCRSSTCELRLPKAVNASLNFLQMDEEEFLTLALMADAGDEEARLLRPLDTCSRLALLRPTDEHWRSQQSQQP